MPSTPRVGQSPVDGPDFLHDLITELLSKYPIDARRMYLFGHSAGASFALYMALYESEYFAAAAIHAGALTLQDGVIVERAKRKIPIHIAVGTVDRFFPLAAVRATRDMLNSKRFQRATGGNAGPRSLVVTTWRRRSMRRPGLF